jgi:hypothetical protein
MPKKKLVLYYFDSHLINVVTSFPLGEIINNRDATGQIAKWALQLMAYGITYMPRTAIKSQALVDFIAEWIEAHTNLAVVDLEYWNMYFDGSLMQQGAGLGVVLVSPSGNRMRYVLHLNFGGATNNIAEFERYSMGYELQSPSGLEDLLPRVTLSLLSGK